jgi:hypothetical protein
MSLLELTGALRDHVSALKICTREGSVYLHRVNAASDHATRQCSALLESALLCALVEGTAPAVLDRSRCWPQ